MSCVLLDIATHDWTDITVSDNSDQMVDNYCSAIDSILDLHCPLKRKKVRVDNSFVMTPSIEKHHLQHSEEDTQHHEDLQPSLDYISRWGSENNMPINTRKTHQVTFLDHH